METIFEFSPGDLLNPIKIKPGIGTPQTESCRILIPARVDTFLCHHHFFVKPPRPQVYPVNSISFGLELFIEVEISLCDDDDIQFPEYQENKLLIEHTIKLMKKVLGINYGFFVRTQTQYLSSHQGFGVTAGIMTGVAQAINLLMGNILAPEEIIRLIAQNFGNEDVNSNKLMTSASVGGAAAIGILQNSLAIVGGEAELWFRGNLPESYQAILLYPKTGHSINGVTDLKIYQKNNISLFERLGTEWGDIKESILKNRIIPSLHHGDFTELFRAINMYTIGGYGDIPQYFRSRWLSHNIFFDKFIHTLFSRLFAELRIDENCFFVSSGGPLIVIITQDPQKAVESIGDFQKYFTINTVDLAREKPSYTIA